MHSTYSLAPRSLGSIRDTPEREEFIEQLKAPNQPVPTGVNDFNISMVKPQSNQPGLPDGKLQCSVTRMNAIRTELLTEKLGTDNADYMVVLNHQHTDGSIIIFKRESRPSDKYFFVDEIDVAEPYRQSFTAGRIITSKVQLQCSTTPLGRLDLAGNLQATVVRNLPMAAVNVTVQALSANTYFPSCFTDYIPINEGVVMLMPFYDEGQNPLRTIEVLPKAPVQQIVSGDMEIRVHQSATYSGSVFTRTSTTVGGGNSFDTFGGSDIAYVQYSEQSFPGFDSSQVYASPFGDFQIDINLKAGSSGVFYLRVYNMFYNPTTSPYRFNYVDMLLPVSGTLRISSKNFISGFKLFQNSGTVGAAVDSFTITKLLPFSEATSAPTSVCLIHGTAEQTNIILQADVLLELIPGLTLQQDLIITPHYNPKVEDYVHAHAMLGVISKALALGTYNYTVAEFDSIKQLMVAPQLTARENQVGYAGIMDLIKVGLPVVWDVGKSILSFIRKLREKKRADNTKIGRAGCDVDTATEWVVEKNPGPMKRGANVNPTPDAEITSSKQEPVMQQQLFQGVFNVKSSSVKANRHCQAEQIVCSPGALAEHASDVATHTEFEAVDARYCEQGEQPKDFVLSHIVASMRRQGGPKGPLKGQLPLIPTQFQVMNSAVLTGAVKTIKCDADISLLRANPLFADGIITMEHTGTGRCLLQVQYPKYRLGIEFKADAVTREIFFISTDDFVHVTHWKNSFDATLRWPALLAVVVGLQYQYEFAWPGHDHWMRSPQSYVSGQIPMIHFGDAFQRITRHLYRLSAGGERSLFERSVAAMNDEGASLEEVKQPHSQPETWPFVMNQFEHLLEDDRVVEKSSAVVISEPSQTVMSPRSIEEGSPLNEIKVSKTGFAMSETAQKRSSSIGKAKGSRIVSDFDDLEVEGEEEEKIPEVQNFRDEQDNLGEVFTRFDPGIYFPVLQKTGDQSVFTHLYNIDLLRGQAATDYRPGEYVKNGFTLYEIAQVSNDRNDTEALQFIMELGGKNCRFQGFMSESAYITARDKESLDETSQPLSVDHIIAILKTLKCRNDPVIVVFSRLFVNRKYYIQTIEQASFMYALYAAHNRLPPGVYIGSYLTSAGFVSDYVAMNLTKAKLEGIMETFKYAAGSPVAKAQEPYSPMISMLIDPSIEMGELSQAVAAAKVGETSAKPQFIADINLTGNTMRNIIGTNLQLTKKADSRTVAVVIANAPDELYCLWSKFQGFGAVGDGREIDVLKQELAITATKLKEAETLIGRLRTQSEASSAAQVQQALKAEQKMQELQAQLESLTDEANPMVRLEKTAVQQQMETYRKQMQSGASSPPRSGSGSRKKRSDYSGLTGIDLNMRVASLQNIQVNESDYRALWSALVSQQISALLPVSSAMTFGAPVEVIKDALFKTSVAKLVQRGENNADEKVKAQFDAKVDTIMYMIFHNPRCSRLVAQILFSNDLEREVCALVPGNGGTQGMQVTCRKAFWAPYYRMLALNDPKAKDMSTTLTTLAEGLLRLYQTTFPNKSHRPPLNPGEISTAQREIYAKGLESLNSFWLAIIPVSVDHVSYVALNMAFSHTQAIEVLKSSYWDYLSLQEQTFLVTCDKRGIDLPLLSVHKVISLLITKVSDAARKINNFNTVAQEHNPTAVIKRQNTKDAVNFAVAMQQNLARLQQQSQQMQPAQMAPMMSQPAYNPPPQMPPQAPPSSQLGYVQPMPLGTAMSMPGLSYTPIQSKPVEQPRTQQMGALPLIPAQTLGMPSTRQTYQSPPRQSQLGGFSMSNLNTNYSQGTATAQTPQGTLQQPKIPQLMGDPVNLFSGTQPYRPLTQDDDDSGYTDPNFNLI